jgi:putative spermidine/putrescine transport system permease protein
VSAETTTHELAAAIRAPRRLSLLAGNGTPVLLGVPIVFLLVLLVLPLVLLGVSTFSSGFEAIRIVLGEDIFWESLRTTAVVAIVVTAITLVVGTAYALGLALSPTWLRALLFAMLLVVLWSSILVRTYGWILIYLPTGVLYKTGQWLGIVDEPVSIYQTTLAMYPAMVHVMLPTMILPIYVTARRLDPQQLRAAQTLGAKPLLVLRKVVIPQLRPAMVAGSILVFLTSLGFYITPQLLGSPSETTIAMLIGRRFGEAFFVDQYQQAVAMSLLLVLLVFTLYVVADRLFRVSERWSGNL